jgi:hypothetical protein
MARCRADRTILAQTSDIADIAQIDCLFDAGLAALGNTSTSHRD